MLLSTCLVDVKWSLFSFLSNLKMHRNTCWMKSDATKQGSRGYLLVTRKPLGKLTSFTSASHGNDMIVSRKNVKQDNSKKFTLGVFEIEFQRVSVVMQQSFIKRVIARKIIQVFMRLLMLCTLCWFENAYLWQCQRFILLPYMSLSYSVFF